jgi:hypothetical protein
VCKVCKKGFSRSYVLNRHLRLHSERWRFALIFHMKRLTGYAHLNSIFRSHIGEQLFIKVQEQLSHTGNPNKHRRVQQERWLLWAVCARKRPLSATVRAWREILKFAFPRTVMH